jgi:hypothetical protein
MEEEKHLGCLGFSGTGRAGRGTTKEHAKSLTEGHITDVRQRRDDKPLLDTYINMDPR